MQESSREEVVRAVNKANSAKDEWNFIGLGKRIEILRKLYKKLESNKEELAQFETKEMGMPIKESRVDIDSGLNYFKWYLDNASTYISPETTHEDDKSIHKVYYEPRGTAAVISPWNFPFSNFIWGVTSNLVVGNTVVYKHSEDCIIFGRKMEKLVSEIGLPEGVFLAVPGGPKVGEYLVNQNVDIICFTGSSEVGQKLYKIAAEKFIPIILELGGSAPGIVFEDANVDEVVDSIYLGKFLNCGQVCDGLKRLLVHESIFDSTIEKLRNYIEKKKVGDPLEENTDIGPLVSEKQLKTLQKQVEDAVNKGAKIVIGGKHIRGNFFEPTILTNIKKDMKVWKEEVFGPVLPIVPFSSEDEAIELANDTEYGLGGYVFSSDKEKAQRVASKLKTGMVAINNSLYVHPFNPFGGYKKSGIGREHGKYGLRELCQIKVVSMEK